MENSVTPKSFSLCVWIFTCCFSRYTSISSSHTIWPPLKELAITMSWVISGSGGEENLSVIVSVRVSITRGPYSICTWRVSQTRPPGGVSEVQLPSSPGEILLPISTFPELSTKTVLTFAGSEITRTVTLPSWFVAPVKRSNTTSCTGGSPNPQACLKSHISHLLPKCARRNHREERFPRKAHTGADW